MYMYRYIVVHVNYLYNVLLFLVLLGTCMDVGVISAKISQLSLCSTWNQRLSCLQLHVEHTSISGLSVVGLSIV